MQIKKLELFGFKSFADRTEFVFDRGITGIVGPNGCGKSNVVDAVKWILGEQSARSLRGHEMSDVIFNGSASRHSLGFAEATLVFDNTSRRLPLDLAEVAVTRRLYRSGESEYMVNRKLCRLKDIKEIFMDTGVGLNAYSLIEQGKVDVLLQTNPQERRVVFEEAAGISKYKAKKKEALRKLERTEQNLVRLGDIIEEIERRLRSVKYQAGKARNYQTYSERLKELRITHALSEYHNLSESDKRLTAEVEAVRDSQAELQARVAELDATRSEVETSLVQLDDTLRSLDNELMDLRGQISTGEDNISFNNTRIEEWRQTEQRDRQRIVDLEGRLVKLNEQVEQESAEAGAVESRLTELRGKLLESEQALTIVQQATRRTAGDLENEKTQILNLLQQTSQLRNDLSSLDLRCENLRNTRGRLQRRMSEIVEQLQRLTEQKSTLESELKDLDFAIDRDQKRLQVKKDEAKRLNAEAEQLGTESAAAKEYRSGLISRQQLLQDLERRGEGIENGVRQVLRLAQAGRVPGVRGMVAELISVDVRYATLIEAALGDAEQYIVIDHRQELMQSLESLEETIESRAGFLPLDALRVPAPQADLASHPGVEARAADLVQCDAALRPMVECLLGRTLLVKELAVALELSAGPLSGWRFVTLAGETIEADGSMRLGRLTARAGLISRKSELRTIDTQLTEVQARIATLKEKSDQTAHEIQGLDEEQRELRSVIYDASTTRVDLVAQLRRLCETAESVRTEQPLLSSEIADLDRQTAEMASRRVTLEAGLTELEQQSIGRRDKVEVLSRLLTQTETERAGLEEQRTHQRVEVAKVEEQRRGIRQRLDHLMTAQRDAVRSRDEAVQELAICGSRIREAERKILQQESRLAELFLRKESVGRNCRQIGEQRQAGRAQAAAIQDQVRAAQGRLHEVEEQLHQLEMELRECSLKMATLRERVLEDFQMRLEEKYAAYTHEEVDWQAIEAEIQELRDKIERLGAVNLEAIKEQLELEQRHEFLATQKGDLEEARRMLDELITRINTESITRFSATFEQVRENFQTLFRKLFGGGKADIVLLNPEDVLESGIEIIARPPGKQPCSISLLSGGEKTLTAVALLMAVFRSKPSPYCILDEVDAALDEANNERFNSIVKEFVKESQFIIITHSKRSMAIADVLYGVTMQEPGVSKKISVRFADIHNVPLEQIAAVGQTDDTQQAAGA